MRGVRPIEKIMVKNRLDIASEIAFRKLNEVGGRMNALPESLRTVVIIYSAQGIIDNGGFQYFFESDFPETPDYSVFIDAYRRIGATDDAEAIARAISLFPFERPHLMVEKRNQFMKLLTPSSEFFELGNKMCGDENVWLYLQKYVEANSEDFSE
jgi:hypothetical protein